MIEIEVYTYADWAGSISDRRSTLGYCTFVWDNQVTWRSKKQSIVARSSAETEFRFLAQGVCEALCLKKVMDDLTRIVKYPMKLYCDNKAAISIVHNLVLHDRTKRIEVDKHFIKDKLEKGAICSPFVPTSFQVADILTKGLPRPQFEDQVSKLGKFDVTFPALPCSILSLDAMDISGEQHLDVRHDITKRRIDAHGNIIETRADTIGAPKIEQPLQRHGGRLDHNETYCGSCYGAEVADEDCCNNCEEVREAYRKKGWALSNPDSIDQCKREGFLQRIKEEEGEGCNLYGFLDVNKVAGNFHFAPGKSFQQSNVHVHDLLAFQKDSFNISHNVNRLAFGDYFPGVVNPLDGVQWTQQTPNAMYQYFLKVVPTVFTDKNGHAIHSNQFSVTEHVKGAELGRLQALPGVFFFYDLSPIKVTFTETHVSFLHFLTNVCAIVGGVFTVSGIIDSFVYHSQKAIKRKMEIGKFS